MLRNRLGSGFTLVELVVYCGLLTLFTTVFVFSVPSRDNVSLENLTYSAERSGLVFARMHRDFSNSGGSAVILGSGKGLAFPSSIDSTVREFEYDSSGALLWRTWVAYLLDRNKLYRYELPLEKAVTLESVGAFPGVDYLARGRAEMACSDVVEFKVEQVKSAYRVTITVDVQGERVQNVSAISSRN